MKTLPAWMELGHEVRKAQIERDYAARNRRKGGRALASWSDGLDRLEAEHEAHKRAIGELEARLDRIAAAFGGSADA